MATDPETRKALEEFSRLLLKLNSCSPTPADVEKMRHKLAEIKESLAKAEELAGRISGGLLKPDTKKHQGGEQPMAD